MGEPLRWLALFCGLRAALQHQVAALGRLLFFNVFVNLPVAVLAPVRLSASALEAVLIRHFPIPSARVREVIAQKNQIASPCPRSSIGRARRRFTSADCVWQTNRPLAATSWARREQLPFPENACELCEQMRFRGSRYIRRHDLSCRPR